MHATRSIHTRFMVLAIMCSFRTFVDVLIAKCSSPTIRADASKASAMIHACTSYTRVQRAFVYICKKNTKIMDNFSRICLYVSIGVTENTWNNSRLPQNNSGCFTVILYMYMYVNKLHFDVHIHTRKFCGLTQALILHVYM